MRIDGHLNFPLPSPSPNSAERPGSINFREDSPGQLRRRRRFLPLEVSGRGEAARSEGGDASRVDVVDVKIDCPRSRSSGLCSSSSARRGAPRGPARRHGRRVPRGSSLASEREREREKEGGDGEKARRERGRERAFLLSRKRRRKRRSFGERRRKIFESLINFLFAPLPLFSPSPRCQSPCSR